jgi:hypothetical protein
MEQKMTAKSISVSQNESIAEDDKAMPTTYHAGSQRSVRQLKRLKFDPIEKLVQEYNSLDREDRYWTSVRNEIESPSIKLNANGQKQRRPKYSAVAHANIKALKQNIATQLLRYGYGRVPENENMEGKEKPHFSITLTTGNTIEGEIEDA